MADPLTLLRQYNISKKTIVERDGHIIFDNLSWPKDTKTNYVAYSRTDEANNYYTLECLLNILKYKSLTHPSYVKKVAGAAIQAVCRPDRRDLLAYLNGETTFSNSIDKTASYVPPTFLKRAPFEDIKSTVAKKLRLDETIYRVNKEDFAETLPKETSLDVENQNTLSEALSAEKIASIKTKRFLVKRATIISSHRTITAQEHYERVLFNTETSKIINRERQLRNRKNILQSTGKTFSNIISILKGIEIREKENEIVDPVVPAMPVVPFVPVMPVITPKRIPSSNEKDLQINPTEESRYNRYDQERYGKTTQQEAGGFQIDTRGTLLGMTLQNINNGESIKPPLSALLALPTPTAQAQRLPNNQPVSRTPIIIIPATSTSLITMYNAKEILEELRFVPQEEIKATKQLRQNILFIQRRKNNITAPYCIVDNPAKLTPIDWPRVVAVFVNGTIWQFKNWPWNSNPVEIFSNICGFHLKYDEFNVDKNIAGWAVTVLNISRYKRYLDKAVFLSFWEKVDKDMTLRKSYLRF